MNGSLQDKRLRAVELFAGIGGFRVASDRCGIETVFANDICPKATLVYRDRFDDISVGDIHRFLETIPPHDVLTAGIPCQPFSSAGKKLGTQDPRGTLFQTVVDILATHRPRVFIIENVKRLLSMENGRHFATILSALSALDYTIEWRLINAMEFGLAQNRQRVVIVGVLNTGESDVVRSRLLTVEEMRQLPAKTLRQIRNPESWQCIVGHGKKFQSWGIASKGSYVDTTPSVFSEKSRLVKLVEVLQPEVADSFDFTDSMADRIAKSTPVNDYYQGVEILFNQGGGARMGYTVFGTGGIAPTVTSTASRHYERYKIGDRFRRLTNIEYARLQGFADDHCSAVSVYDQYALYGNAFPPPMAEWALRKALTDGSAITSENEVGGQLLLV